MGELVDLLCQAGFGGTFPGGYDQNHNPHSRHMLVCWALCLIPATLDLLGACSLGRVRICCAQRILKAAYLGQHMAFRALTQNLVFGICCPPGYRRICHLHVVGEDILCGLYEAVC